MKTLIEWMLSKLTPVYEIGYLEDDASSVVKEHKEAEECYLDQHEVIRAMR